MMRRHSTRLSQAHDEEPDEGQDQRTAALDYPELGSVLTERPDPGRQITVIGMRREGEAYAQGHDERDEDYNGGEGATGTYWAEPAEQGWMHENAGPQEEAPPPLYDPDMLPPAMARLAAIEEAQAFFGLRHHATTINGTQVDDAGDAPQHGTVPRAEDPDAYDDASHEGEGDDKWDDPLPWGSKTDENAATVGMYPEGISSGSGPGISVGPFTAAMTREEFDDLRRHMKGDHGEPDSTGGYNEFWAKSLAGRHAAAHAYGQPGHSHGEDYEFNPYWDEHEVGGYHEFTGLRREARVPWTGKERGQLHRWQEEPTATWGDFVPSSEFPALKPGEHVSHEDEGEGIGAVEGASDRQWEEHLRHRHGWDDARIEQARQAGRFRDVHEALHQLGLPDHRHAGGPEDARDEARDSSVTNMFGPAYPRRTPQQMPLTRSELGGSSKNDPATAIFSSEMAEPPRPHEYYRQFDPARFRRMMSSLDARNALLAELEDDYPPEALDWIRTARVTGPHLVPLEDIDWSDRHTWTSYKQPRKCGKFMDHLAKKTSEGEHLKAALIVSAGGKQPFIGDGHHRSLVQLLAAASGEGEPGVWAFTARVDDEDGPWDTMHDRQFRATSKDSTKRTTGPDAPPGEVEQFQGDVDDAISSLGLEGEHDEDAHSLDAGPVGADADAPASQPDQWPAAGAAVTETSRAMTQGKNDGKVKRRAHLAAFTRAAGDASFRFEFTAAWNDVVAKAKRIRAEGHVRIVHASAGMVIGEVRGDHDTYESGIQRPVGKRLTIQHWACGCPWASFHQDKSHGTRYAGRPCSHVMALQFEAQARGMFGRYVEPDTGVSAWSPPSVVVKSWPPYEGEPHAGRWREEWRAPLARRHATPDEARDWNWTPEERDEWERAAVPAARAATALLRAGEEPGTVGALCLLAGMRAVADQANAPWGSNNVTQHPPQKPYGATSPPNKDQDPGSYGPLAAPDPENWGGIQEDSAYQMPIGNTASAHQVLVPGAPHPVPGDLHWPDMNGWQAKDQAPEDQDPFRYTDRANAAGPSTAITPRDPNGIRMEESARDPRHPWPSPYRQGPPSRDWLEAHLSFEHAGDGWSRDDERRAMGMTLEELNHEHNQIHLHAEDELEPMDEARYHAHEGPIDPVFGALASGTPFPYHDTVPQLDGALAELKDGPEPALPEVTADEPGPGTLRASGAADGTIGGTDAGTGQGQGAPLDEAALGEFGAAVRASFRQKFGGTPMGDLGRETSPQAQQPSPVGQSPGLGATDDYLSPDDTSIQTVGNQQWSGGGADSDEVDVPAGQPQGGIEDIVASFQRSAAARGYEGGTPGKADGDIAVAARQYLAKTAEVLPKAEADELIREGAGHRARNLDLLRLEGTHYQDEDEEMAKRGLSLDDYDDDVIFA
jgi:hypothetical protein